MSKLLRNFLSGKFYSSFLMLIIPLFCLSENNFSSNGEGNFRKKAGVNCDSCSIGKYFMSGHYDCFEYLLVVLIMQVP